MTIGCQRMGQRRAWSCAPRLVRVAAAITAAGCMCFVAAHDEEGQTSTFTGQNPSEVTQPTLTIRITEAIRERRPKTPQESELDTFLLHLYSITICESESCGRLALDSQPCRPLTLTQSAWHSAACTMRGHVEHHQVCMVAAVSTQLVLY